jgi:serine/threonine protein kinase
MQFNSNSDFPASHLPPEQWHTLAHPPPEFDPAQFIPCACLTARVLMRVDVTTGGDESSNSNATDHPAESSLDESLLLDQQQQQQQQHPHAVVSVNGQQYSVMTAKGVLVPSRDNNNNNNNNKMSATTWSDSSDDESSSDDYDDDDVMMDNNGTNNNDNDNVSYTSPQQRQTTTNIPDPSHSQLQRTERAYWLRGTLRQAIFGTVRYGIILNKLDPPIRVMLPTTTTSSNINEWTSVEWEATNESVAVKEMSWEHIKYQRSRLVEDPIKEVAAMQYLSRWMEGERLQQQQQQQQQQLNGNNNLDLSQFGGLTVTSSPTSPLLLNGIKPPTSTSTLPLPPQAMLLPPTNNLHTSSPYQIPQNMLESHIMTALDLFTDHKNLYSIMPYCSGGELFDVLERKNRFTELEARYWMRQILRGLACLKKAGVAHRDLSLENLLVHDGNVLVIDMGMCLKVPTADNTTTATNNRQPQQQQRYLIVPQGVCGKWNYMSPEVCNNKAPFDGAAVDLWAAGVILFLMLTGFPPWERPVLTDERFRYMSNGYLVQMLIEWNVGLSADAMDLLQRMFWLDPLDRLSLEQVWSHPWMAATQHACIDRLGL